MQTRARAERGRLGRRIGVAAMVAFVVAGLLGFFGHRQGTAESSGHGYSLTVSYPETSRGGLAANWEMRLERADGQALPPVIEVRSRAGYFDAFDQNGLNPQPQSTWADGDDLIWSFSPPPGAKRLEVSFDARLQPNARGWRSGRTAVVVDGDVVVSTSYRMLVIP